MKTSMSLKEAITKRAMYRSKLKELLTNSPLIGAITVGSNPPEGFQTVADFKSAQQSEWDKRVSLRKNITNLTTAIQVANSTTTLKIDGIGEVTISAALELQELFYPFDRIEKDRMSLIREFVRSSKIEDARIIKLRDKKLTEIEKNAIASAETLSKDIVDPEAKRANFETAKNNYIKNNSVNIHKWDGFDKHFTWYETAADSDNLSKLIEVAVQNASGKILIEVELTDDTTTKEFVEL